LRPPCALSLAGEPELDLIEAEADHAVDADHGHARVGGGPPADGRAIHANQISQLRGGEIRRPRIGSAGAVACVMVVPPGTEVVDPAGLWHYQGQVRSSGPAVLVTRRVERRTRRGGEREELRRLSIAGPPEHEPDVCRP